MTRPVGETSCPPGEGTAATNQGNVWCIKCRNQEMASLMVFDLNAFKSIAVKDLKMNVTPVRSVRQACCISV